MAVRVRLLGPFSVVSGGRAAGPWPRPSARRLCQLVLVSPGRRVSRDLVCEELFADLDPRAAARSVSKALSMARAALAGARARARARPARGRPDPHLGEPGRRGRRGRTRAGAARRAGDGARATSATTCSRPPWPRTASCSPTSRTPTGRCARGSGWRRCARRRGWPWPGTGPGEQATQGPKPARRLGGLRRARPRLRGGGRGPGPGLLRRGAPGARGARLRALPGRPRRARARPVPVAGGGVRHGRLRGRAAPDASPGAGGAQDRQRAGRRGGRGRVPPTRRSCAT